MAIRVSAGAHLAGGRAGAGALSGVTAICCDLSFARHDQFVSLGTGCRQIESPSARIRSELSRIRTARLSRYSATQPSALSRRERCTISNLSNDSRSDHDCLIASASIAVSSRLYRLSSARTFLLHFLLTNQPWASSAASLSLVIRSRRSGLSSSRCSRLSKAARYAL